MIGTRIREERERLGYTQQGLADVLGVAKRTFIDWEKERTSPTGVQLSALSNIGVDVNYVITGMRVLPLADLQQRFTSEEERWVATLKQMTPEQRERLLKVGDLFIQPKSRQDAI